LLRPIGKDPASGCWEFCLVGTGKPPLRHPRGHLELSDDSGIVLVLLPGGTFLMGSQREDQNLPNFDPMHDLEEEGVHRVEVEAFLMSKFEVSNAQWARMGGDCEAEPEFKHPYGWRDRMPDDPLWPVAGVPWRDAFAVVREYSLSLPKAAQWEYACRAGTETPWWTGADRDGALETINCYCEGDSSALTLPIDSGSPNAFGLHHMCGNVEEICLEPVSVDRHSAPSMADLPKSRDETMEKRWASLRIGSQWMCCRGGSYSASIEECRSTSWDWGCFFLFSAVAGVRPVMNLPESTSSQAEPEEAGEGGH
ncbi:MAG: formylglycine-generating enzyme family protein, partial [Planctomycetes bacterium]|nr:formylglycine-generating enzyme family protein [Planctomycetota bacterium]